MDKVVLTGFCRSGTTSIAEFFKLFDIPSYHQKIGPGKNIMQAHNIFYPPAREMIYYDRKAKSLRNSRGFESSWEFAHFMYGLSNRAPNMKWLIMLRDPEDACNSLKNYNMKNSTIDALADLFNDTILSVYKQARIMDPQPRWMDFEKYIAGEYTRPLFSLFDIPTDINNLEKAKTHLTKKIRTSGEYEKQDSVNFVIGRDIVGLIKKTCPELI